MCEFEVVPDMFCWHWHSKDTKQLWGLGHFCDIPAALEMCVQTSIVQP